MPRVTEQHREGRRRQITLAAARCFHRDGFHATTMDSIIREAGLSAGAVYRYFPSKDAIIAAVGLSAMTDVTGLIEAAAHAPSLGPPDRVFPEMFRALDAYLCRDRGIDYARIAIQGWGESTRNPELRAHARALHLAATAALAHLLGRWRDAGAVAPSLDPDAAAPSLLSLLLGFLVQRVVLGDVDPETYAAGAAQLTGR
ncbi:MAG: TetR/AcrR family transcriptional regulator [Bifidobacteriaceae bacterium]|jgi:AcrR family transcriptional regulator|nr:TetR/AcrR family transcriptional regulator [Bifidobacteriaceae bacterium]